ncbi:hypothetical protein HQ50_02170 [Porphyromonas sp. COT-052 OH4946]|nr:hypothetical protein HQ50_02170 [Porphyromonas sp. COT-052 OH4946]
MKQRVTLRYLREVADLLALADNGTVAQVFADNREVRARGGIERRRCGRLTKLFGQCGRIPQT